MKKSKALMLALLAWLAAFYVACGDDSSSNPVVGGGTVVDPNTIAVVPSDDISSGNEQTDAVDSCRGENSVQIETPSGNIDTDEIDYVISLSVWNVDSLSGYGWNLDTMDIDNLTYVTKAEESLHKAVTICSDKKTNMLRIFDGDGDSLKLYLGVKSKIVYENCERDSLNFANECASLNGAFVSEGLGCTFGDLLVSCLIPMGAVSDLEKQYEDFYKKSSEICPVINQDKS